MTDARVLLWGSQIGAVTWVSDRQLGVFQYYPEFLNSGIQLSPLRMLLKEYPYEFPELPQETFWGLPGLLADSLPDKFGNAVINSWLASQGRTAASFNPVERLCYIGKRGMGALEFEPAILSSTSESKKVEIAQLVALSNKILDERSSLHGVFSGKDDRSSMEEILRVGTSAGGARAKAILAWNPITQEFRSGQGSPPPGFEHWIMKFDGVSNNRDKDIADPLGYGQIEYAYHLMALAAGLHMMPCRLHHEGGRSHFMSKRFDRLDDGSKVHMQSLGALTHTDFNQTGSFSYEETIQTMKLLHINNMDIEQQIIRAMFNVVARNQDDHIKNIAFLMDRAGRWSLSPAYDVTYAYNPGSVWTSQHQMSINGKFNGFDKEDLISLAALGGIKTSRAMEMLEKVINNVSRWPEFANRADVSEMKMKQIQSTHRLSLLK